MSKAIAAAQIRQVAGWQYLPPAGALVIALYYALLQLGPAWALPQAAVYGSANGVLAVACLTAARRHRSLRSAMLLLAASALSSIVADVIFYYLALIDGTEVYPSVADIFYLAAYPLMALGLLQIVRRRTPGWGGASGIDGAIAAVSAGYLVFEFMIAPVMAVTLDNVTRLVSVAYPVGDLMLILVGSRLMLGAGPRSTALRLLGGYLVVTLVADTLYGIQTWNDTYAAGNFLDVLWMSAGFLLAAGVSHPRAPQLVAASATAAPDATRARLVILAIAAMTAPTVMMAQSVRGVTEHILIAGLVCNILFLLVLARMYWLVRAQRYAAITDGLTGLRSRRYFEQALQAEVSRAARSGAELSMLLLDIDHFKLVNDTYGHSSGDRVLVEVAQRLAGLVRSGDLVARYGGEEFAVLLPGAGPEQARDIAERMRAGIGGAPIAINEDRPNHVTVSVGVAGIPACATARDLVLSADRALYAAKNAGRDRVAAIEDLEETGRLTSA
ncbi:MAG: GGDEF domain-containing protein [Actinoplanes sp.]